MITRMGLWHITRNSPKRLLAEQVEVEKDLENWIERDPSLLQNGLKIVGRQVRTLGGSLDLLAIDVQGRWIVIEVKRGRVRRDTITQALDYASCIRNMTDSELSEVVDAYLKKMKYGSVDAIRAEHPEAFNVPEGEREVEMIVVGTARDQGLERMVEFLKGVSLSVVTFEAFKLPSGERVLVRELTEADTLTKVDSSGTVKEALLLRCAANFGMRQAFESLLKTANEYGLKKRITNKSIMFAPAEDGRRVLFLVYADKPSKDGGLRTWVYPPAFKEFYGSKPNRVIKALGLGAGGWISLTRQKTVRFVEGLKEVLSEAAAKE